MDEGRRDPAPAAPAIQQTSQKLRCDWTGDWDTFLTKHRTKCEFAPVVCSLGCGTKGLLRRDLEEHERQHCRKNRERCQICGQDFPRGSQAEHS